MCAHFFIEFSVISLMPHPRAAIRRGHTTVEGEGKGNARNERGDGGGGDGVHESRAAK